MCRISNTSGESSGAQLNFRKILEQILVKIPLSELNASRPIVQLKIAADAAKCLECRTFLF